MSRIDGVRDIVGVRRLPPPGLTSTAVALRAQLGRLHRSMAPPPVRVLEALFGLLDHGALVAFCELGVPDVLESRMLLGDLARAVGADGAQLERVVRYAAARGWVRMDGKGRVRPTATTRFLRRDHPGGWRAWVEFAGGSDVRAAVSMIGHAAADGGDAYALANGEAFFAHMAATPERARAFDRAMAAGARMHGLALATALDWSPARRVCDVGGGDGSLLRVLLAAHPHLQGVLLD
ncbi:MAG: hypothetical protein JO265_03655, partial [Acidimicrobiia bacterium]|nr:hypothetical protein [Acidimicrobiia bacterium]